MHNKSDLTQYLGPRSSEDHTIKSRLAPVSNVFFVVKLVYSLKKAIYKLYLEKF